jgi:glucose-6-phosphate isomerase
MSAWNLAIQAGRDGAAVAAAWEALDRERVVARLWRKDHTLWKPAPTEIANRLGWLTSPRDMMAELPEIHACVHEIRTAGYTRAVLLGMGGSSLAPEVFRKTFGVREGYLDLAVLDSTDPGAVLALAEGLDPVQTLFIVATKSGGTVETFSLMKFFHRRLVDALGPSEAGRHFIAITDPGSALAGIAARFGFRRTFLNNPDIGGRYSALSCFGLAPAALIGVDVRRFLERAAAQADAEREGPGEGFGAGTAAARVGDAPLPLSGALIGAALGGLAAAGRDKLTFFFSPPLDAFGDWLEQLIAESTGKEGKGILPIVGETPADPAAYGTDRVFALLGFPDDPVLRQQAADLAAAGHPVIRVDMDEADDLGAQCLLWEVATAVAGWRLGINPFDQPDVESAKGLARERLAAFRERGRLPEEAAGIEAGSVRVYGDLQAKTPGAALAAFLDAAGPGGYVVLQAYVRPTPEMDRVLLALRTAIRDRHRLAVASGYGPRFLHSTGQLHKGDAGRGRFIQITADDPRDAVIPDEMGGPEGAVTFGTLKRAQAAGDGEALRKAGRPVIRFHFIGDATPGLAGLAAGLRGTA